MTAVTRLAYSNDLDRAAEVLGEAFADYPWTRWTVDPSDHQRRIVALQRIALEHFALRFGGVSVSTVDGDVRSVVAWNDSEAASASELDAAVAHQVAELEGSRHDASKLAEHQVERALPSDRHLYLATVGTSPMMQGQGLATKTLAPLLEVADDRGLEVWLETSRASNADFYERRGFEVASQFAIDRGGPTVWVMFRKPIARRT